MVPKPSLSCFMHASPLGTANPYPYPLRKILPTKKPVPADGYKYAPERVTGTHGLPVPNKQQLHFCSLTLHPRSCQRHPGRTHKNVCLKKGNTITKLKVGNLGGINIIKSRADIGYKPAEHNASLPDASPLGAARCQMQFPRPCWQLPDAISATLAVGGCGVRVPAPVTMSFRRQELRMCRRAAGWIQSWGRESGCSSGGGCAD